MSPSVRAKLQQSVCEAERERLQANTPVRTASAPQLTRNPLCAQTTRAAAPRMPAPQSAVPENFKGQSARTAPASAAALITHWHSPAHPRPARCSHAHRDQGAARGAHPPVLDRRHGGPPRPRRARQVLADRRYPGLTPPLYTAPELPPLTLPAHVPRRRQPLRGVPPPDRKVPRPPPNKPRTSSSPSLLSSERGKLIHSCAGNRSRATPSSTLTHKGRPRVAVL